MIGTTVASAFCLAPATKSAYCYQPEAIHQLAERVDCALDVTERYALDEQASAVLFGYLKENFSLGSGGVRKGFETLFAELSIMYADEAFARAFAGRFDLAEETQVDFQSGLFEPRGPRVAGVAGGELHALYRAAQYYERVVERFHLLSPYLWRDLATPDAAPALLSQPAITSYLSKLLQASARKARTYAELGRRFQAIGKRDVARQVLARQYQATYLEGNLLASLMRRLGARLGLESQAQAALELQRAQRTVASALLEMRSVYESATDEERIFGLAPDHVPFPPDETPNGPVRYQLSIAEQLLTRATSSEQQAIADARDFEVAEVSFIDELRTIANDYEDRLAELCGTFTADDGSHFAATIENAGFSGLTRYLKDPCGLLKSGSIYQALLETDNRRTALEQAIAGYERLIEEVEVLDEELYDQCQVTERRVEVQLEHDKSINTKTDFIKVLQGIKEGAQVVVDTVYKIASLAKCEPTPPSTSCTIAGGAATAFSVAYGVNAAAQIGLSTGIAVLEKDIQQIRQSEVIANLRADCDFARVKYRSALKRTLLDLGSAGLEIAMRERAVLQSVVAISDLRAEVDRTLRAKADALQDAINLAAGRWDPNVRIYQTNSMLAASRDFDRAIRAAFEATRAYEYHYAQQSYSRKEELFLVRMASNGDISLRSYLDALSDATSEQEQEFARPDRDVLVLSLLDDVLAIPEQAADGTPLSITQRVERMRSELVSSRFIDATGALRIPFATQAEDLSGRTWGHRVDAVEVEIIGTELGDSSADLLLVPVGTSVVRTAEGDGGLVPQLYYSLPSAEAKLDPVFNGVRVFEGDISVYRNYRLRNRPVINTQWDLILDQRNNRSNQDIDLQSLRDIRLYIYFNEFTGVSR